MKKTAILIAMSLMIFSSCARLGDFTIMSTKNVTNQQSCVELKQNVEGKSTNLETAIDKCIEQVDGGMYLTNVVITTGAFQYKVKGDVWGIKK